MFHCGGGDHQIGVALRKAAPIGIGPKLGRPVQNRIGYGEDTGMLTKRFKTCDGRCCADRKVATPNLVTGHGRKGELTELCQISSGMSDDCEISLFDDFRENIGVE